LIWRDELVDRFQAMQRELDALLQKSRMQDERIRQLEAETSGHDQNFFIASPDGNFRLNLEGQIQVRYAYGGSSATCRAGWEARSAPCWAWRSTCSGRADRRRSSARRSATARSSRMRTWPEGALSLGAVVQGGVFIVPELEFVARWEGLWVQSGFDPANYAPNALNAQTLNIVTLGLNWYFNKNALKFSLDGGHAFNPVRFQNGLFGENIGGADWRPSWTGQGAGEVVVRGQLQLLF
jgi:hypothetical protein